MAKEHKVTIDLDMLSSSPEALGKLYECGMLLVQSNNEQDSQLGYQLLEMVDDVMSQKGLPSKNRC